MQLTFLAYYIFLLHVVAVCKVAAFDLLYTITSIKQVINKIILNIIGLMCKPFFIKKDLILKLKISLKSGWAP